MTILIISENNDIKRNGLDEKPMIESNDKLINFLKLYLLSPADRGGQLKLMWAVL